MPLRPKSFISVHGRFHAFELATELHRHGMLEGLATTYPAFAARRFLPEGARLETAPLLEAARRLHARLPHPLADSLALDPWLAERFGRFAAKRLPENSEAVIAWSGAAKELIPVAHKYGARVILERGSTHIVHQAAVLAAVYERFGVAKPAVPPALIEREVAEYGMADAIAVPTRFAARTFMDRGVSEEKIIVNPYGVSLERFLGAAPRPEKKADGKTRILFVGRVDLRKGIPWLLQAFAPLAKTAELHLVGPVAGEIEPFLRESPNEGIVVHGSVSASALPEIYRSADIFCLPSLEEGLALVLFQAMASGLPVVATDVSGAEDLIVSGEHGYLVPPQDSGSLSEKLSALVRDSEKRRAMGLAAERRVEQGFTWRDYGERAVQAIEKIVSA